LLKYLIKHKHWSPFEMVSATIEINTTRDIARQILRHRSFSFQEFSQRYAEVDADPIWREAREQDPNNRQNSRHVANMKFREQFLERQLQVWHHAWTNYKLALKEGVAKEQARALLPEGLTPSKLYMAGTLRSWLHFIELRSANGTQMEHQEIAKQCAKVLTPVFRSIFQSNSNGE
jgi:thymidylate synthase (FAD)